MFTIFQDYAVLENESNNLAEKCREQQAFCDQQRGNNNDALLENMTLSNQLGQIRMSHQRLTELNTALDSEVTTPLITTHTAGIHGGKDFDALTVTIHLHNSWLA